MVYYALSLEAAHGIPTFSRQASLYEPNPAHSFFGSHYKALRAIKAIYDPIDLFVVPEGVGSGDWDVHLHCRI